MNKCSRSLFKRILFIFFSLLMFGCETGFAQTTPFDYKSFQGEKLRFKIPLVDVEKSQVEYSFSEINIFSNDHFRLYHTFDSAFLGLKKMPESEPPSLIDSTLKVIFKRWLFIDTISGKGLLIDSSDEESVKIVDAKESIISFYNLPEAAFDTKADILVRSTMQEGDTLCDVFIPTIKADKTYPDSMYYFYVPFSGYSDFSLSRNLEAEKKKKLVKVKFIYILKEEQFQSDLPITYSFQIELEKVPSNTAIKWQVVEKFLNNYSKLF